MFFKALNENRRTLALASPIVAGHVGQMLMGWADTIMIGRVGVVPLAACAFANTVLMVPFVFGFGVLSAVSVRGALGYGRGTHAAAGDTFRAGLLVAAGVGLGVAALVYSLLGILPVFGQKPEVNAAAGPYLMLCGLSVVPALVSTSAKNFSEAFSRPWVPFWILLGSVLLNVFLNWVLIFGNLGAPALGLEGAGWATLFARLCGAVVMIAYPVLSARMRSSVRGAWVVPALRGEAGALLALGLPVGALHLAEVGGFALGSLMMGWIGVDALAAHQIAITCAATTFMVPLGLSQALGVRVGQARGAGDPSRCAPIVWGGLGLALAVMSASAIVLVFAAGPIARVFTNDPNLIPLSIHLLVIAGFFQIFDGVQIVSSGALRGFEDVKFALGAGILAWWFVALPVCWVLGFAAGLGATGVWLGFCAGLVVAAGTLLGRLVWRLRLAA
jgi:multidrug resistance protein, MATE family